MCRWVAYRGQPIYMEEVVTKPSHSLIDQSLRATEAKTGTNGDGFGIGWYSDRPTPGAYRELRPAWSDENLRALCEQVRSGLFFAHVRASTGTATSRANCHPFIDGKHMFMHNGQVGCYGALRRRIENLIPDSAYQGRNGTTDSEAIFLIAMARGAAQDPVGAMASTLAEIKAMMRDCEVCEPLRFTAALSNGEDLFAFRWACDDKAPTLYYRETADDLIVVSEPLDSARDCWRQVPQGHALVARRGKALDIRRFEVGMRAAA
jgi:glutamine amidotransferase